MSISGISSSSVYQSQSVPQQQHKKAGGADSTASGQTPSTTAAGTASAKYHAVSGASGRIDIKA